MKLLSGRPSRSRFPAVSWRRGKPESGGIPGPGRPALVALCLAAAVLFPRPPARAQDHADFSTLYTFGIGSNVTNPSGRLLQGTDGNFYGTTITGGDIGYGTVFMLTPAGVLTIFHSFAGGGDGNGPAAGVVQGSDGNFYGTTAGGNDISFINNNTPGTVFMLTPAGVLTTLYNFTGESDGGNPACRLVEGADGNFYGTTPGGDGSAIYGTVFQVTPAGAFTTLYRFTNGSDGAYPSAGLVLGSDGNFYGTTGGYLYVNPPYTTTYGSVFKITPAGAFTPLYSFTGGSDGLDPGGLVLGSDGNFYGSTAGGGADKAGTVFMITPAGALTTLYSFTDGSDGAQPSELVQGSDGNFYGTAADGGSIDAGTVFMLTPTGVLTTLHTFTNYLDGGSPSAGLIQGSDGSFYGPTSAGGDEDNGTIFKLEATAALSSFFTGEVPLENNVYYLSFPNGNFFGYYTYLSEPNYLYHFDLGYEYVFDAADGQGGVYFYDFASNDFFYTSPAFAFPFLYDFNLNSVVYYYPDPKNPGHYNTDGVRYFYVFNTGLTISK